MKDIAIGAGCLEFNFRAYQIGHMLPCPFHKSSLSSKGRRAYFIIINFLIHGQCVDVIIKASDYDIKIQL